MNVISVNVGLPTLLHFNGRTRTSAIVKKPVYGKIEFKNGNLIGDKQADLRVHGGKYKAIYLYPSEHYEYWEDQMPDEKFEWGAFGENITSFGLMENDICIGDKVLIGTIETIVSQPRFPCENLNFKFQREDMVKKFADSRKHGFYVQVTKQGFVSKNDKIEIIQKHSGKITIQEFVENYYSNRKNQHFHERLLKNEYVPDSWLDTFK